MTKMLKFMKPHSKVVSPERLQKQKELFGYNESCYHGFPAKSSALAWDSRLRLLAIATRNGQIRVYGQEGVEFYGKQQNTEVAVIRLCFLPGMGALVSLCDDNSLHLWKFKEDSVKGGMVLVQTKSTSLEGKLKKISSIVVEDSHCKNLLVGTEGGNIYILDLKSFTMTNDIIYQDVVMQNVPEDYKVNPGPVEVIAPHLIESNKILIGYQRGLIVLWDRKQLSAEQTYISNQQLESVCWNSDASEFISCHNDGSYVIWSLADSSSPCDGPTTVYGPFPCKPINRIIWKKNLEGYMIVFGGGMPRASYGDRHTVTVIQGDNHITFNVTSRVIDFVVTEEEEKGVSSLIILAEEEIVFIDLVSEGWPTFQSPYLSSLHSSAVTCSSYVSKVDSEVFVKLKSAGNNQRSNISTKSWPINGGTAPKVSPTQKDILLSGHEDGTVRFWDASGVCISLMYKFNTAPIFVLEELGDLGNTEDDDWPPFRKVGLFDPYSDDPRLAIKKLEMCPHTGQLLIGGTAGQIIVLEIGLEDKDITLQSVEVNLVAETDSFVWRSHNKLNMHKSPIKFSAGLQPMVVMQFYPPASCTSLNLHSEWGLVAAGTAHGFALFDYVVKKNLLAKSTLSPLDLANAADEGPFSRRKSLKKSLRESFRRLRKGRSQKKPPLPNKSKEQGSPSSISPRQKSAQPPEDEAVKPMERAIEARSQLADYIGSMVRCLHLTKCYIASNQLMSATLWAGTNSGAVYIFTIAIPPTEKRLEVPLTVQLGKEIHLKHGAPVINIIILDGVNAPFPDPMAVKRGAASPPDTSGPHRVFITSEEQFKVFTLPHLKPYCKFKLTAQEGSRVRKVCASEFVSTSDKNYKENCAMVITNQGDLSVYSLPDAKKQVMAQCIKKEDIGGIDSVVFTKRGEALYLVSASELLRISLSAEHTTAPSGKVCISDCQIKSGILPTQVDASLNVEKSQIEDNTPDKSIEREVTYHGAPVVRKMDEPKENGDTSILSGDITIDSIRDHMDELKNSDKILEVSVSSPSVADDCEGASGNTAITTTTVSTIKEEESSTKSGGSVTVVKTSNVTFVSSQDIVVPETTSVQVVETNQIEENHAVNGTEAVQ